MHVLQSNDNTFLKLDRLVLFIQNKENVFMACPEMKMKRIDFVSDPDMDMIFDTATKKEFLIAVNLVNHMEDWYSLLIKDLALKLIKKL